VSTAADSDAAKRQAEQAVRRSNEVWAAAVNALDAAPLDQVYTGQTLAGIRGDIERYRSRNQVRTVRLIGLEVVDIKLIDANRAVVVTEEQWYDRITDPSAGVIRDKNPWRFSQTYELVRIGDRWLVANINIREH
jgi:hypothetical protein